MLLLNDYVLHYQSTSEMSITIVQTNDRKGAENAGMEMDGPNEDIFRFSQDICCIQLDHHGAGCQVSDSSIVHSSLNLSPQIRFNDIAVLLD